MNQRHRGFVSFYVLGLLIVVLHYYIGYQQVSYLAKSNILLACEFLEQRALSFQELEVKELEVIAILQREQELWVRARDQSLLVEFVLMKGLKSPLKIGQSIKLQSLDVKIHDCINIRVAQ